MKTYRNNWENYSEIVEIPENMAVSAVSYVLETAVGDRGNKVFELSNHLGNVLATVSDKKLGQILGGSTVASYYEAQVQTAQDYYAFGWGIPSRKIVKGKEYRYGFNGVEQDSEWNGGQSVAFEFRTEDPRIGRFLSTDPLTALTPWESPFAFAGNNPIANIDYLGLAARNASSAAPPAKRKKRGRGGKFWESLRNVFRGIGGRISNNTDPEKYLDDRLKVDMSKSPDSYKARVGGRTITTTTNAYGHNRNSAWYWDQVRNNNPQIEWSKGNKWRMDRGYAPKSDPTLRNQFPQFNNFKNQIMDHHHLSHGKIAHGLPRQLHTGAGYTKMWHVFKKASKVINTMFLFVSVNALANDPISVIDPTGMSMVGDIYYENLEHELFMASMMAGEETLQRYMSNCLSCGEFGVFYGNNEEINNFINGTEINVLKSRKFFVGNRIMGVIEANQALGTNNTLNGIIYLKTKGSDSFIPMGVISLPND